MNRNRDKPFLGGDMDVLFEGVHLIRWPAEAARLDDCRRSGELRLLVVEGPHEPPVSADLRQDWVRPPLSRTDLRARAATLRARAGVSAAPQVDPSGVVRYGSKSVATSPIETVLIDRLVAGFESLVLRDCLLACMPKPGPGTRNALDLHIMRLRRRLAPLGLGIRTAWGRGYVLEASRSVVGRAPVRADNVKQVNDLPGIINSGGTGTEARVWIAAASGAR